MNRTYVVTNGTAYLSVYGGETKSLADAERFCSMVDAEMAIAGYNLFDWYVKEVFR